MNCPREGLVDVLEGRRTVHFHTRRHDDVLTAIQLSEELGFEMLLHGASEACLVVDAIKKAGVPGILHPTMTRTSGTTQNAAFPTAATLHEAGVPVAIQSRWAPYVSKTRIGLFEAALATANVLPRTAALASVSRTAADILGLENVVTIAPGQVANLVLFDGDPFECTTRTCTVRSGGDVVSEECK